MKNVGQPIRDSAPWISQCTKGPRWLNNIFLLSTEIWAEQLKKAPWCRWKGGAREHHPYIHLSSSWHWPTWRTLITSRAFELWATWAGVCPIFPTFSGSAPDSSNAFAPWLKNSEFILVSGKTTRIWCLLFLPQIVWGHSVKRGKAISVDCLNI